MRFKAQHASLNSYDAGTIPESLIAIISYQMLDQKTINVFRNWLQL